jgi:hypothetical protein
MSEIYFLIKHTPFWAIPLLVLALEFGYIFWLRKKKTNVKICLIFAFISLVALGWYYYAGGPDKAVRKFMKWHRSLEV